jgi:hypothetical protein
MQLELDLVYPLRMGIPIKNGGFYGKTIGKIHGKYRGHIGKSSSSMNGRFFQQTMLDETGG